MLMTIGQAVEKFNAVYTNNRKTGDTKFSFYCGITNNLERRNTEHNIDKVLYYVTSDTFDTAKELESLLHEEGYDTGDKLGNGTDDTKIVYMYRKGSNTIE